MNINEHEPIRAALKELEDELEMLLAQADNENNHERIAILEEEITALVRRIKRISIVDDADVDVGC